MELDIKIDDGGVIRALEQYPALKETVIARAATRTAEWVRTRIVEGITTHLTLKKSDLDGSHRFGGVKATKATRGHGAAVKVTGRRIPLFLFGGRPKTPPGGASLRGVSYQISRDGGRQTITGNAFTARTKSGHVGFFRRMPNASRIKMVAKSGARAGKRITSQVPIGELYGPSIPHVAASDPAFNKLMQVDAGERLNLQVQREISFALTGTSKTG